MKALRWIAVLAAVLMIAACGSQRVVELKQTTTQTDSLLHSKTDSLVRFIIQKDTVQIRDSVFVMQKNDTTLIYKEHTEYRYIFRTDSSVQALRDSLVRLSEKRDSIPYPVEVVKIQEKKYTPTAVKILAMIGILTILYILITIYNKRKI